MGRANNVVVVIGTPVDEFLGPSMTVFDRVVDELAPKLVKGTLVVLRSTVYPGTTEHVAERLARVAPGTDVAFCPERIAEGKAMQELFTLPQIVSARTPQASPRVQATPRSWLASLALRHDRITSRESASIRPTQTQPRSKTTFLAAGS